MDDWRDEPITVPEVLVSDWLERLKHAKKERESFDVVAEACRAFYGKSAKFMWEDSFRKKFIGNINRPRFEITMNAAFEYVAIFGPYLFWDYPHRTCRPYDPLELDPDVFVDSSDPYSAMMFDQLSQQQQMQHKRAKMRCAVMEKYLNYSQREQTNGLWLHANMAIKDALLTGRGILVPRIEDRMGGRRLTGLFRENPSNLFIDPDCCDPLLESATWTAMRHVSPVYQVEDRFGLPRGTLSEAGNLESVEHLVMNNRKIDDLHRQDGRTNDLIVWYEIWSKCGVDGKTNRRDSDFAREVERVVGDDVYLCIAPSVPWLLNAPPESFYDGITDEEVVEMLGWPFPTNEDNRWPFALLDFYPDTESPWPQAPLSAGLGHLICLNVLISAYVEQAYENRKSIIAVMEECQKDVEEALGGRANPAVVKLKTDIAKDIRQVIQYLNRPDMNSDILKAIDMVMSLFQKATGLVDFMYGTQQTQDRAARTTAAKEEKTAIRPEQMAKDVAAWQTNGATLECLLATLELQGMDVEPQIPAMLWDRLITMQNPEVVMREMDCVVEATDVRRPNRERTLANLQTMNQQVMSGFVTGAQINGDSGPINAWHERMFKAMELPFDESLEMKPWVPMPPPPEVQQQMQMEKQAEQQKLQMEMQKSQMELQGKQMDLEGKQLDSQTKQQDAAAKQMTFEFKSLADQQKLQTDAAKAELELSQDSAQFNLDLFQDQEMFRQQYLQKELEGEQKIRLMRQQAAAKQKPVINGRAK